jgi:hypothetical protein
MNREVTNGVISDDLAKARWAGNYRINQEPNRIWVDSTHLISEESDQRMIGMALKIKPKPPGMSSATVWHEFIGKSLPCSQSKRPFGTSSSEKVCLVHNRRDRLARVLNQCAPFPLFVVP